MLYWLSMCYGRYISWIIFHILSAINELWSIYKLCSIADTLDYNVLRSIYKLYNIPHTLGYKCPMADNKLYNIGHTLTRAPNRCEVLVLTERSTEESDPTQPFTVFSRGDSSHTYLRRPIFSCLYYNYHVYFSLTLRGFFWGCSIFLGFKKTTKL